MPDPKRVYRQLALLPATWRKLDAIRARSHPRWQLASRPEVLEEIIERLPEDYSL